MDRTDLARAGIAFVAGVLGLAVAGLVLPGIGFDGLLPVVLVALVMALAGLVVRPLLVAVAPPLGWVGALVLALFGQAALAYVALAVVPGVRVDSFAAAFVATWIVAGVATLATWLMTAGTNDAVFVDLVRRARRAGPVSDPEVTGILFVQLDGVPYPVLEWGVLAGTLPTLSRWIRSGSHEFAEWTPTLPATTPASQMGILHGTTDGIPAFRWVDRATGRVFVANKPADAVDIEALHSNGLGLLVDGGVSVSNLFSGDAPTTFATMSRVGALKGDRDGRRLFNRYLMRPDGFVRGVVRTVSELARERLQARRQVRQDMRPRVHRGWGFAGERGALNGVLRDFNTIMVGEALAAGARSVYVDYVDYDAVAHHAGIMRPESLDALVGLDAVLGRLEQVAEAAPRDYRIVVLSDHGQSQGEVFADRYGESLSDLVSRLAGTVVTGTEVNTEGSAQVGVLTGEQPALVGQALRAGSSGTAEQAEAEEAQAQAAVAAASGSLLVFGSGNLGLVYAGGESHRLTRQEIERRWPALLPGLTGHEGVSFVVVQTADGPVAIGPSGEHRLRDGVVVGTDPLTAFRPEAAAFLLRASSMPEAPD
ncbi:MAG TPA: phage holin family protein, partial [Actinotalea sp.]|nr:phage holin family protein [Actinotalea sp.]